MQEHAEHREQRRGERHGHAPARAVIGRFRLIGFDGLARPAQHDAVELRPAARAGRPRAAEHRLASRQEVVEFAVRASHVTSSATVMAALSLPTA
jgi:hypothetical protein